MRVLLMALVLLAGCGPTSSSFSLKDDPEFQELKKKVAALEQKQVDGLTLLERANSQEERLMRLAKKVEAIRAYLDDQQKNSQSSAPHQLPRTSELFPQIP